MKPKDLIDVANSLFSRSTIKGLGYYTEVREFLRVYAGEKSTFYIQLSQIKATDWATEYLDDAVRSILEAFILFAEKGPLDGVSIQREAQIDVVSDLLGQADNLLSQSEVHAAAPTVLIGASLQEFLRNWVEALPGLSIGNKKPSIEAYASTLREADLLTKQDAKDITSWGGLRNAAAHGKWDEVNYKKRIRVMLEGVNLFMRRYSSPSSS
jgi:hypothetical protein